MDGEEKKMFSNKKANIALIAVGVLIVAVFAGLGIWCAVV